MNRNPGRFPTDIEIQQSITDANVDTIVAMLLQTNGIYEARQKVAELIITLRGHTVTRDNRQFLPGGIEAQCDKCGMKLLIPVKPKPGEAGVYGRATELNCPAARKGRPAEGYADMPAALYEKFLIQTGIEKPWERPTSFEAPPDRSAEYEQQKNLEQEAMNRFDAKHSKR